MNEKVILTKAQSAALRGMDEDSEQGETWCSVEDIDVRVLNALERDAYITIDTRGDGGKVGRITAAGKVALGNHIVQGSSEYTQMLRTTARTHENGLDLEIQGNSPPSKPYQSRMRATPPPLPPPEATGGRVNVAAVTEVAVEQIKASKAAAEPGKPACDCATCIHREVLDLLRAKYPKIDALVTAMETVRQLQNELGIEQ